ncbi:unnamed protein product [Penicillium nalgiovense]|uniref:Uncharacterized protein n=1 Tax=Penicillium nalgiovense TaxID=60175 RepID=A0A9W4HA37_PENNA|nr:unnamed protein product [Penicillium nalgiovense]CAG7949365.1 unnamed protein product [Penicillium nalgiovense]CAG7966374.1 unnamed protein product [Penicillium nalgiovense]CAG8037750.1 unnamed protein product [Penicillium nalgiovense]CAG8044997.1 unnamed protein product [Penicillium nalgiovense]
MAPARQSALKTSRQRSVSAVSRLSERSVQSTTSDFLDAKLSELESDLDYIRCVRDGLNEARQTEVIAHEEFQRRIYPFLQAFRASSQTIHVAKRQRRLIIEDVDENVDTKHQPIEGPVDQGLLERAYRDVMIPRVLSASAKRKFNQSAFKEKVHNYYGVNERCAPGYSWCHVFHQVLPEKYVKAAYLVPKSMTAKKISHLFGVEDGGTITIVPKPGPITFPTEWRCVVLDKSKNENIVGYKNNAYIKLKSIDGKALEFITNNRPRQRYLYFCFIIAYLNAKSQGANDAVAKKVEATRFWPSGGEYLDRSTLVTLARCVSGSELPESLKDNTFDSGDNSTRDADAGTVLGADVRDACSASYLAGQN